MSTISIPIHAYRLDLFPMSSSQRARPPSGPRMRALVNGLAVPSFWSSQEIQEAFVDANRIWQREAQIKFDPIHVTNRTETVPDDEGSMWPHFINNLSPQGKGLSVSFVFDLPSHEGGWGGGRIVALSGRRIREGIAGFSGSLLAHEFGHVLLNTPGHSADRNNLMFGSRHPRIANVDELNSTQKSTARTRAMALA